MKCFILFTCISIIIFLPFCVCPPPDYLPSIVNCLSIDEIIERYFKLGFIYTEILAFLFMYHNIEISMSHLKRVLKSRNLARRKNKDDLDILLGIIEIELASTGRNLGYRAMYERLKKVHNVNTDKETVRLILKILNPDLVRCRLQRRLRRR